MGSQHLGQVGNQGFANSQILNQQQLGIFKTGGPVRATAFEYKMDHFAGHNGISTSGQMIGGRKNVAGGGSGHNSQKTYKRGTGSMGPSHGQGSSSVLRPGTAQKRPGSPNT